MKQICTSLLLLLSFFKAQAQCNVSITPQSTAQLTACQGNSVTLRAVAPMGVGTNYQWYLNGSNAITIGNVIPGATNDSLVANSSGYYSVIATNGSCSVTSTPVYVNIAPPPAATIYAYPSSSICQGDTTTLMASVCTSCAYQWKLNGVNAPGASVLSNYTTTIPGTYTITVVNTMNYCVNTSSLIVTVSPRPNAPVASANTPVCAGDTIHLNASTSTTGVTYEWGGPNGYTSLLQQNDLINATGTMAGNYKVRAKLNGCYSAYDSVQVAVTCLDSLWPGDANYDRIVDNNDILQIALGYGNTGFSRTSPSIAWLPQFSKDWGTSIAAVNAKHADCDGDGIISQSDTTAVSTNYSLTHLKGTHQPKLKGAGLPDLYFDLSNVSFIAGTTVYIPIKLGSTNIPMSRLTGIAAKIGIMGMPSANSVAVTYPVSWLGTSTNTIRFHKSGNGGLLHWAYARTDHRSVSGQGTLASLELKIPANATGQIQLYFEDVKMIDSLGTVLSDYNVVDDSVQVIPTGIEHVNTILENVSLFPNPTSADCNLNLVMNQAANLSIRIDDITGRVIWQQKATMQSGRQQMNLPCSRLQSGIYFVRVLSDVAKEVKVIKLVRE